MTQLLTPLTRAWIALLILSIGSTIVASLADYGLGTTATGAVILLLAWFKARTILSRYLGLWKAPSWNHGFNWVLAAFCLILLGLYLVPALM
ncbi:cytochrome C oxidase subunit IV family protein [Pseudovibrio axinellae]|nr:cytochrome C oxidase subunit IV family protein [Pseudovibrio axinellae]